MQNVYVMIGLPGSGKDTWIKNNNLQNISVSRDDIRAELGYCNAGEKCVLSRDKENEVSNVFNNKLLNLIKNGNNAVINNINLKRKYRDSYKELLKDFDINWIYVYVKTDSIDVNIERRKGEISKEIFQQMVSKFEKPTKDEYNELIVINN